ncbi:MAG: hypothetical protein KAR64_07030, partial [Thermoplasmatales archaeon]|nr:hypothetical protein [Thermoplasmatales archaeon]
LDRRKLLLYYYHLGILYKYGILHWRIMYDMFAISDLKIIPKILIPLAQEHQNIIDEKDNNPIRDVVGKDILMQLYYDSPSESLIS